VPETPSVTPIRAAREKAGGSTEAALAPESRPDVRIARGRGELSIWSLALFGDPASPYLREFLSRAFSVKEVAAVEIRRDESLGLIQYDPSTNARELWLELSRAIARSDRPHAASPDSDAADSKPLGVESLYLEGPPALPIRVNRVGATLSTWRLRFRNHHRIRLTHPILFNRKDVAYRLEEELSAIFGVEDFRTNTLSCSVAIQFDPDLLDAERLVRQLERSWPKLLKGLDGPPSGTRLVVAGGLSGLAYTGQYIVPSVKPLALAGVTIYGLPNLKNGIKQLARRQVGLPVLYSAGLIFTLVSGMPFSSAVMAVLMQFWPRVAHRTMTKSQRRLFAIHRQRATWARIVRDDGQEVEADIDALKAGDLIAVRKGEIVPIDGVVTGGLAAVDEEALHGAAGAVDKTPGDAVYAASFVRDGSLTIRVEQLGIDTVAGYIGARLPHARIDNLLSSAEAERIASRNAKPALALAGINLLATRRLRPSQAVIRPDYATAPRLSAQLSALHSLGDGLQQGIFFRDSTALDRLPSTDVYVFDDSAALERRQIQVAEVFPAANVSADAVLGYAAAAFPSHQNERVRALVDRCGRQGVPILAISQRSRHAGAVRYLDHDNRFIEIASPAYIAAMGINVAAPIAKAIATSPYAWEPRGDGAKEAIPHREPFLRPLWVLRDVRVLGVITFSRQGESQGTQVIAALKARNKRARFVYVSSHAPAVAEAIADGIGISTVLGNLDEDAKAREIRRLGRRTMWIGDGTTIEAIPCIEAATVSISVAGFSTASADAADIVLLQPGLDSLVSLRSLGRGHRARIEADYRAVYTANLLGVAGGLMAGFGSLESGLTSNAGTGYVYTTHWKRLRDLVSRVEARRAVIRSSTHEESIPIAAISHAYSHDPEQVSDYRDRLAEVGSDSHGV